jgi:hypothetical protein
MDHGLVSGLTSTLTAIEHEKISRVNRYVATDALTLQAVETVFNISHKQIAQKHGNFVYA